MRILAKVFFAPLVLAVAFCASVASCSSLGSTSKADKVFSIMEAEVRELDKCRTYEEARTVYKYYDGKIDEILPESQTEEFLKSLTPQQVEKGKGLDYRIRRALNRLY